MVRAGVKKISSHFIYIFSGIILKIKICAKEKHTGCKNCACGSIKIYKIQWDEILYFAWYTRENAPI